MHPREALEYTQRMDDNHDGFIRNFQASKGASTIAGLIGRVFKHHCAVFDYSHPKLAHFNESDELLIEGDEERLNRQHVAKLFYREYFVPPRISAGVKEDHSEITIDEFISRIIAPTEDPTCNNIKFLLGDVGCGKTAFINSIITNNSCKWLEEKNIWFVRVDAHLAGAGTSLTYNQLIDSIIDKTRRVASRIWPLLNFPDFFRPYNDLVTCSEKTITERNLILSNFFNAIYKRVGVRPLLIIDNLDQIFHAKDNERFYDNYRYQDDNISHMRELVATFFQDKSTLGRIHGNILFVLRHDTYDALRKLEIIYGPHSIFTDNLNACTLSAAWWKDVVQNRSKLLKEIADRIYGPQKVKDIEAIINPIIENIEKRSKTVDLPFVDQLFRLGNHGLRSVMDFFSQYCWIDFGEGDHNAVIGRYIRQCPVGLLAFMLNGHRRFSQERTRFPNIYRIVEYRGKSIHSYWIMRLLIELIDSFERRKRRVTADVVRAVFIGENDGYPSSLVNEMLGQLSEVHAINLIRPKFKMPQDMQEMRLDDISLTKRAKHFIEYIIDRFYYLQLIVEDYELWLPNMLINEFDFSKNDYSYLIKPPDQYGHIAEKMIEFKSYQVFLMLEILKESYEYEKKIYPTVFERLTRFGVGINVEQIKKRVYEELNRLSQYEKSTFLHNIANNKKRAEGANRNIKMFFDNLYRRHFPQDC